MCIIDIHCELEHPSLNFLIRSYLIAANYNNAGWVGGAVSHTHYIKKHVTEIALCAEGHLMHINIAT